MPLSYRFTMSLLLAFMLFTFASWQGALAATEPTRKVQIVVDPYSSEIGTEPMTKLLQALDEHPDDNLFRVTWKFSGFLQGMGSAVYNRSEQTVKYWYHTHTPEYADTELNLVLKVTPELMRQVIQEKKDRGATDGAFFDRLYEYGCPRKDVQHRHRSF